MTESPPLSPIRENIAPVIQNKNWYAFRPDGGFDWKGSLDRLAISVHIPPERVEKALTNAFTADALTNMKLDGKDVPLLEQLSRDGYPIAVWTSGDPSWQQIKMARSGCPAFVRPDMYFCYAADKKPGLPVVINCLARRGSRHIIVVDDKQENLATVPLLDSTYKEEGVAVSSYLMGVRNEKRNAAAFYQWLTGQAKNGNRPSLVLDLDGVIIDTDRVMKEDAVRELCKEIA